MTRNVITRLKIISSTARNKENVTVYYIIERHDTLWDMTLAVRQEKRESSFHIDMMH